MKKINFIMLFILVFSQGCQRSSSETWENIKTAGSYLKKGFNSLCGREVETQLAKNQGDVATDYIPLNERDLHRSDQAICQPNISPGEKGIPSLCNFKAPRNSSIFNSLHYETDQHVIRSQDDLLNIKKISDYLKKNPKVFLSIEGHCDERASAAYNMALGARRANHVRVLLIKQGIDCNRLYTISHGKEKPTALGHSFEDWQKNRRTEFKIYEK